MKFFRSSFIALGAAAFLASPVSAAEVPGDYEMTVTLSNVIGNLLALHQVSAKIANYEMSKRGILKKDARVRGWISEMKADPKGILFTYIGDEAGVPQALYRVFVHKEATADVEVLSPAQALTDNERARVAARDLAMTEFAKRTERCAERYDPIVLHFERSRDPFIYVYLLPVNDKNRVAHAGGEVRYEISADGLHLDDQRTFGKGCLTLDIPRKKNVDKAEVIRMTQVPDPTPTEWQVLVTRTSSRKLAVDTPESGLAWMVHDGKIELVGPIRN